MKIYNKIIESATPLPNKHDIWLNKGVFYIHKNGCWTPFTVDLQTAEKLKNMATDLSSVYQEILIPEDGIIIENNKISLNLKTVNGENIIGTGNIKINNYDDSEIREKLAKKTEMHFIGGIDTFENAYQYKKDIKMTDEDIDAILNHKLIVADSPYHGYIIADEVYYDDNNEGYAVFHYNWQDMKIGFDIQRKLFLAEKIIITNIVKKEYVDNKTIKLSDRIDENEVLIEDLQNTKIDKEADDYYPQLSVGTADNLAGVEVVSSEFTTRQSGGSAISDGVARVQSIKGNSVVWNQLVSTNRFTHVQDDVSITISESGEVYAEADWESALGSIIITPQVQLVSKHKYLYNFDIKKDIKETVGVYFGNVWNNPSGGVPIPADTWYHVESIATPTEDLGRGLWIYPWNNTQLTASKAWIKNVVVYDLTKMFGEGNEPSTIEEFYARLPLGVDLHAYNEGEVVNMNVDGIKSVGVNVWDEQWERGTIVGANGNLYDDDDTKIRTKNYIKVVGGKEYYVHQPTELIRVFFYDADKDYISYYSNTAPNVTIPQNCEYIKCVFEGTVYNNDVCINIYDADINGKYFPYEESSENLSFVRKYFPNGMNGVGSAYDEIRYNKATNKWEKVVRFGYVELGTLSYSKSGVGANAFYTLSLQGKVKNSGKLLTSQFCQVGGITSSRDAEMSVDSTGVIYFNLFAHTDAASFKAAMQGVMLYYELAEPIVTEIEEKDFNLDYLVWNGGTEEAIASKPSSALRAEITYGFNAVGKIKEIDDKLTELSAEVSGLSERIENLPSGESDVFEAIKGETSYDEIKAAFEANKVVYCYWQTRIYMLTKLEGGAAYFAVTHGNYYYRLVCYPGTPSTSWDTTSENFQHTLKSLDNGNAQITIAGKTAEVATPQYVENLLGTIINGEY